MGITKHIIGSLGDIGAEIVKETINVPKDVAGKALESLGTPSGQKTGKKTSSGNTAAVGSFDATPGSENKKIVARTALQALAQTPKKEPSDYENRQMEEKQKREMEKKQAIEAEHKNLPKMSSKQKRGDLYGIKSKRAGSEIGKNVKAE